MPKLYRPGVTEFTCKYCRRLVSYPLSFLKINSISGEVKTRDWCVDCDDRHKEHVYKEYSKKSEGLAKIGVPIAFQTATVDDFSPSLILKLPDKIFAPGALIYGQPSIGKTHLAAALTRRELQHHVDHNGIQACWANAHDILAEIRDTYNKHKADTEVDLIKNYVKFSYLVIDDLGAEKNSEWAMATICNIIDHRMNLDKVTVITSNLGIAEIAETMDSRIAARLMSFVVVHYKGRDRRRAKGKLIELGQD